MTHSDQQIIERVCHWLQHHHNVTLFTVIDSWGSAPRPAGSMLAINQLGEFAGSVSGGCIDDYLMERVAAGDFQHNAPQMLTFGDTTDSQLKFKLPCGGRLQLLAESDLSTSQFSLIAETLNQRQRIARRVCLATHEASLHATTDSATLIADEYNVTRNFGPCWRMILIGAGELSQYIYRFGEALDYQIFVCDPREPYRSNWPLGGITVSKQMPDDLVTALQPDDHTIILTLSHDPKLDDMALMTALTLDAFYVGALGSKQSSQTRQQRLLQLGLSAQQITKLHAPVGLDIGSRTPAEIALAILADITAQHHGKTLITSS